MKIHTNAQKQEGRRHRFAINVYPKLAATRLNGATDFDRAHHKLCVEARRQGITIGDLWLGKPAKDGKPPEMVHYVDVAVGPAGEVWSLVLAARKLESFFGPKVDGFLYGDYQFPVHVWMILHDARKRERRAPWRGGLEYDYVEPDGDGFCRVYYSVIVNATAPGREEAESICRGAAQKLAAQVDSTFHDDLAVDLRKDTVDQWRASYEFAVRVKKGGEFAMVEETALRLWKEVAESRTIYVELDDDRSLPLYGLVNIVIPRRRPVTTRSSS